MSACLFALSAATPLIAAVRKKKKPAATKPNKKQPKKAPPKHLLLSEKDPLAKSLKYKHNGAGGPRNQSCVNCLHYHRTGMIEGSEAGTCILISKGLVLSKGWCVSWVKARQG